MKSIEGTRSEGGKAPQLSPTKIQSKHSRASEGKKRELMGRKNFPVLEVHPLFLPLSSVHAPSGYFFPYTHFVPRPFPDSHSPIRGASAFQFLSGSIVRRPWSLPLCSRRLQLRLFSHANRGSIRRLCLFTWCAVSPTCSFHFLFLPFPFSLTACYVSKMGPLSALWLIIRLDLR